VGGAALLEPMLATAQTAKNSKDFIVMLLVDTQVHHNVNPAS